MSALNSRGLVGRNVPKRRLRPRLDLLEARQLLAAKLIAPPANLYPSETLQQPPIIRSQGGTLDANLRMVRAGESVDHILYGTQPITSAPDPNGGPYPTYAMAYQVEAYGTQYAAQYPGPIFQLASGDSLNLHVQDDLDEASEMPALVFTTNFHTHGFHVSPLSEGDNIYREIVPGEGMNVAISVPEDHPQGLNWYHVHRHGSTHEQVYGGLAGMLVVGDPLAPWPQYQETITQVYMALSEVNIQAGVLSPYTANITGPNFYTGWQKTVNGQVNPTIRMKPGETQVWNMADIGAFGGYNLAITDGNLQNPWNATLLVQDGNGQYVQPYGLSMTADPARMADLGAATLLMPGNRLSMAVNAPTTPGTYYLIDGWAGQDFPEKNGNFYTLATIEVAGDAVTTPPPVFGPVGGINPLFDAVADVERTFEFTIQAGATPAENLFLINGKTFGNAPMPQMQIGTVEEWLLTNPSNRSHPFHIHQGDFIVTEVNGVAVNPHQTPPPGSSSLAYLTGRDVMNIPAEGSIKIRFEVKDFPGKYVFHCHILKHEDQGMMSPVLAFGPADGLRLPFGTEHSRTAAAIVLDGEGRSLGVIHPFGPQYRGSVVAAAGLGASAFYQTMAVGTGDRYAAVRVYEEGSLESTATFRAFERGGGVSLAVGALGVDGQAVIVAASRGRSRANIRLFTPEGTLIRELAGVLPGVFPRGVNVAVGDVNGDNFDDLIVGAGRGRSPMVVAIDGADIATGVHHPATLFQFTAAGGSRAGARVSVGYVAPATVGSYLANVITTAEAGPQAGLVQVWNPGDFLGGHVGHSQHPAAAGMPGMMPEVVMPMASFRPFGRRRGALQLQSNYLGRPGIPMIATWRNPHRVAFSTINLENQATTQIRRLGS